VNHATKPVTTHYYYNYKILHTLCKSRLKDVSDAKIIYDAKLFHTLITCFVNRQWTEHYTL